MAARPLALRRPPRVVAAVLVALGWLALSGCKEIEEAEVEGYQPAHIEPVGDLDVMRVTLTQEAASRVGLDTATSYRQGRHTVVPYSALIYDGQGTPWVYTTSGRLVFQRAKVVVDRIDDDVVLISAGLRAGTTVATVGAAELYGAELDIAGGH